MIDLETMGTTPGCAIVSIGAVQFDLLTGKIGQKFYVTVDIESCLNVGLTINGDTLMWWLDQGDKARAKLKEDPTHIMEALTKFSQFIALTQVKHLWGNSASFDCSILAACYDKLNLSKPWSHWDELCFRTIKNLFPGNFPKKNETKAHNPIYDCEYQIGILIQIMKGLKGKNYV